MTTMTDASRPSADPLDLVTGWLDAWSDVPRPTTNELIEWFAATGWPHEFTALGESALDSTGGDPCYHVTLDHAPDGAVLTVTFSLADRPIDEAKKVRTAVRRRATFKSRKDARINCWQLFTGGKPHFLRFTPAFSESSTTEAIRDFLDSGGSLEWARRHRMADCTAELVMDGSSWRSCDGASPTLMEQPDGSVAIASMRWYLPSAMFASESDPYENFTVAAERFDTIFGRRWHDQWDHTFGWRQGTRWFLLHHSKKHSDLQFELVDTSKGVDEPRLLATVTPEPCTPELIEAIVEHIGAIPVASPEEIHADLASQPWASDVPRGSFDDKSHLVTLTTGGTICYRLRGDDLSELVLTPIEGILEPRLSAAEFTRDLQHWHTEVTENRLGVRFLAGRRDEAADRERQQHLDSVASSLTADEIIELVDQLRALTSWKLRGPLFELLIDRGILAPTAMQYFPPTRLRPNADDVDLYGKSRRAQLRPLHTRTLFNTSGNDKVVGFTLAVMRAESEAAAEALLQTLRSTFDETRSATPDGHEAEACAIRTSVDADLVTVGLQRPTA